MKVCSKCGKENCIKLIRSLCEKCYYKMDKNNPSPKNCEIPNTLTEQQHNLIVGHLLGDGSIRSKGGSNSSLSIMRQSRDIDYLTYTINILHNLCNVENILPLTVRDKIDKRTNKNYRYVAFESRNLTILNDFNKNWYNKDRLKIIPRDLELTAEIIAIWFCDDGWTTITGKSSMSFGFATNGFLKEDVVFLISLLEKRYDVNFNLQKRANEQYCITTQSYGAIKIIKDIESVFPKGMERKKTWNEEIIKSIESSNKCFSYKLSKKNNINNLIKYFANIEKDFTITELGTELNWTFQRKSGNRIGMIEVPTSDIMKYMQQYIDDGYISKIDRSDGNYKKGHIYSITDLGKEYFNKCISSQ